jgi:hypothetical protein
MLTEQNKVPLRLGLQQGEDGIFSRLYLGVMTIPVLVLTHAEVAPNAWTLGLGGQ